MDWADTVQKKPRVLIGADSPTTLIHSLMSKVIEAKIPNNYQAKVRFSKLPLCSILFAREVAKGADPMPFSMSWFVGIGTAIHDTLQTYFPLTKNVSEYVWGDWKCAKCLDGEGKPVVTVSHCVTPKDLKCPKCKTKNSLSYSELEVNYKGVTGHIDLILLVDDKFYMLDFKSCSQANIDKPDRFLPYPKNIIQIECYCAALKYQFDMDIYYYCLVYVSRDSTDLDDTFSSSKKRHHFSGALVTPKILKMREKQLDRAAVTKKAVARYLQSPTKENLMEIDRIRPCRTQEDYTNKDTGMKYGFMRGECAYLDSCCGSGKMTRAAKELHKLVLEKQ